VIALNDHIRGEREQYADEHGRMLVGTSPFRANRYWLSKDAACDLFGGRLQLAHNIKPHLSTFVERSVSIHPKVKRMDSVPVFVSIEAAWMKDLCVARSHSEIKILVC